jgi:cell division protein ZipA
MIQGLSDTALLRIAIAAAAIVLFAIIWFTSRRKAAQGRRMATAGEAPESPRATRTEPTLRELIESGQAEASASAADPASSRTTQEQPAAPAVPEPASAQPGARPTSEFDKIVSVFLVARAGQSLSGPDLVVAAEKAGLVYGHMNIYHRLVDKHPELGPVFSVANLVKPGFFDLRAIKELHTPGINFFITLPGPIPALDAWDTLLPTAQRMAELLDAVLLDEERNALGRQRIANIRDELRAYDRAREKLQIRPGR